MKRRDKRKHVVDWSKSVDAHQEHCRRARERAKSMHGQAAIRKQTMAGKVIAVNPKQAPNE